MPTTKNSIRSATWGEAHRAKVIALSSFVIVLMLTVAITVTAVSLSNKPTNENPNGEDPVSTTIVFGTPVNDYTSILKNCSLTELQYNDTMKRWESHKSVDVEAPLGTAVLATYGGTVASVATHTLYGRQVTIEHSDGLKTVYSNLDENVNVSQGDRVEKGQQIGVIGQTGSVEFIDTPHVRIEVYKDNVRIDPNDYIDFATK